MSEFGPQEPQPSENKEQNPLLAVEFHNALEEIEITRIELIHASMGEEAFLAAIDESTPEDTPEALELDRLYQNIENNVKVDLGVWTGENYAAMIDEYTDQAEGKNYRRFTVFHEDDGVMKKFVFNTPEDLDTDPLEFAKRKIAQLEEERAWEVNDLPVTDEEAAELLKRLKVIVTLQRGMATGIKGQEGFTNPEQ